MFRRLIIEHWQTSLALGLFGLSLLGTLLMYLYAFHLPREKAARRAAMALGQTPEIPVPAQRRSSGASAAPSASPRCDSHPPPLCP